MNKGAVLTIVGRSSSHFTRTVRMFAAEVGTAHRFRAVRDLFSASSADFAGNPALRLPILETADGAWYGSLNICRELFRRSPRQVTVVWPEGLTTPLLANASELVSQAMATEVTLVMTGLERAEPSTAYRDKLARSLTNSLDWLDERAPSILDALPADRGVSMLEISLFCLVTHLEFRNVLDTAPYENLAAFCRAFGARRAAASTAYRFDT